MIQYYSVNEHFRFEYRLTPWLIVEVHCRYFDKTNSLSIEKKQKIHFSNTALNQNTIFSMKKDSRKKVFVFETWLDYE